MFPAKVHAFLMGAMALGMGALVGSVVTTGKAMHSTDGSAPHVVSAALRKSEATQSAAMRPEGTLIPTRGPLIVQATPTPAAPGASANPPAAPASLPPPIAFQDALLKAANDLFSKANLESAPEKVVLVIDPLIDGVTGGQSVATQGMERRIIELVRKDYPRFEVTRFNSASVAKEPVVLIGTFTAINMSGASMGPRDAYRICLALADLRNKKIISKGFARATTDGINPTPIAFFKDSPLFVKDPVTDGYIRSCQGTKAGDPLQQAYVDRIAASAIVNDAIDAYNGRKYKESLALYENAAKMIGGDQLRVLNGIYLANWRLNRHASAEEAFGKVVDYGLKIADPKQSLAIKFLFRKNASRFDRQDSEYAMWLKQIAQHTAKASACLEIVGHTSPTGPAKLNDRLSEMRAEYVKDRLVQQAKGLNQRLVTSGAGSRELIVGTGKDDASDALDRRVEFKTAC
jgi:outer membrane protein OmpA-like peptidoglycan-associated protein